MEGAFGEYRAFLETYASFLEEMAAQTQERYGALVSFNGERVTKAMSGLQSHIMQLRNMEAKRIELQERAGYGGLTFSELMGRRPEEEREALRALFRRIEMAVGNIKFLNEKSLDFAKEGLASVKIGDGAVTEGKNLYAPPVRGKEQRAVDTPAAFEANY